jgi:hypothetical protein
MVSTTIMLTGRMRRVARPTRAQYGADTGKLRIGYFEETIKASLF